MHLEMRAEELRAGGMAPEAAQREALRRFGDLEGTRRYCRQQSIGKEKRVQRSLMFGDLMADVRISLRGLLRARLLTLAIVATVGVGIGATTVIFSGINAALLRPLPYPAAGATRVDLHRCAAQQVPFLSGRLPRAPASSRRTSTRLPRTPIWQWHSATA